MKENNLCNKTIALACFKLRNIGFTYTYVCTYIYGTARRKPTCGKWVNNLLNSTAER